MLRCLLVLLLLPAALIGAPPVELPKEVPGEPGAFVVVRGKTNGKAVRYLPLDAGLNVFPADLLSDRKATVVTAAKPGRYRLLAYSSVGDDPTEPAITVVVIGDAPEVPPPPKPKEPDPKLPTPTAYYFLVVRKDGPADFEFTRTMSLPEWGELRKKGHSVKDKTVSDAKRDVGLDLPSGVSLPVVVTLSVTGGASKIVRDPVPLPTSGADVLKLPELK